MGKNKIIIHIPPRVYFGGDVIHGIAEVIIQNKIKYRGIRFLFAAAQHSYTHMGKHSYSETLVFLSYRLDLFGSPRHLRHDAKTEELPVGLYRFPFAIVLPVNLPSSYTCGWNFIRYRATAYVDIPMGFDLSGHFDLRVDGNQSDSVRFAQLCPPMPLENHKSFIFASGKLSMIVGIQTSNFFVGDTVIINMKVDNGSTKNVEDVKVNLHYMWSHIASGVRNRRDIRVHKQKYSKVVEAKNRDEFVLEFRIPYLVASTHTRLITAIYWLEVRLDLPWAADLEVCFPIEIMHRDPKLAHLLPPPGPLVRPSGGKYLKDNEEGVKFVPEYPSVAAPYKFNTDLEVRNFPPPVPPPFQAEFQPAPTYIAPNYADFAPPAAAQQKTAASAAQPAYPPGEAPPPTIQPVSLTKHVVSLKKEPAKVETVEQLPAAPPLYPILQNYEYPSNINAAVVEQGHYKMDSEEQGLLSK